MKKNRIAGTDMIALTWMLLPEEDQDRIGHLWTEYGDTLVRWSYDRLGRTATYKDAEDIVTEAFARLVEHYAKNEKVYLSRFLEDGQIPISNNRAENAIRPYVVGRKNWLFNITEGGADNQAILYSIVNTAKTNGLNVEEYFTKIFSSEPGTIIMPW